MDSVYTAEFLQDPTILRLAKHGGFATKLEPTQRATPNFMVQKYFMSTKQRCDFDGSTTQAHFLGLSPRYETSIQAESPLQKSPCSETNLVPQDGRFNNFSSNSLRCMTQERRLSPTLLRYSQDPHSVHRHLPRVFFMCKILDTGLKLLTGFVTTLIPLSCSPVASLPNLQQALLGHPGYGVLRQPPAYWPNMNNLMLQVT